MVTKKPPGSFPGMRALATNPAMIPMKIAAMSAPIMAVPYPHAANLLTHVSAAE